MGCIIVAITSEAITADTIAAHVEPTADIMSNMAADTADSA